MQAAADLKIPFVQTETTVPLAANQALDKMVERLKADESLRANVIAYASETADQASTARRVSLSRGLSVRAYLIDHGINGMRINVQAEGDKATDNPKDRVDIFIVK